MKMTKHALENRYGILPMKISWAVVVNKNALADDDDN